MITPLRITKRLLLLSILLCSSLSLFANFTEDFSDGNYTDNPTWVGDYTHFAVNSYGQLQSKAPATATSYLSTSSTINSEAEWTFFCRIATKPTAYNYMRFYLISSTEHPLEGNGWYVQIGGTNKNITLYKQSDAEKELVIVNEQRKQILNNPDNKVYVRVRLQGRKFTLASKIVGIDEDFVTEGEYITPNAIGNSDYFSILVKNTTETGTLYYADDIQVKGETNNNPIEPPTLPDPWEDRYNDVITTQDYFSPNGDGVNDICLIHYALPTSGFMANIRILTPNGLLINTLTQNELLSAEGEIPWDGTTARGGVAAIGIYVLFCEFTHPQTGQIIQKKLPIVVSDR